jgi:hypothetical protein
MSTDGVSEFQKLEAQAFEIMQQLRTVSDLRSRIGHRRHTDPGLAAFDADLERLSKKLNAQLDRLFEQFKYHGAL